MKIVNRIQVEILVNFAFAVGGMLLLCLPGIAVSAVNKLAGVDLSVFMLILPLLLAGLMPYLLPLGYLLAIVVTYGRLAVDNEWTAIRMAGFHPVHMLVPAIPLGVILSVGSLWFMSEGLPVMRQRQERTAFRALRDSITHLSPGRTELHLGKFNLIAGSREGDEFIDAVIHVPAMRGDAARTLAARKVRFEFAGDEMIVYLTHARTVHELLDVSSGSPTIRVNLDELQRDTEKKYTALRYRRSSQLRDDLAKGALGPEQAETALFEVHQRDGIGSIYAVFMLLGIPIGLLLRTGTQLSALTVAVAIALVYYVLAMRFGAILGVNHFLPPILSAWAVSALGLMVGALLMRKALRQ